MKESEFQSTLQKIESMISGTNFEIIDSQYNPESFGNYYIIVANDNLSYRLTKDRNDYILEGKEVRSDDWIEINRFVKSKFAGSTLAVDLDLHKVGREGFNFETILKLLPKLLAISHKI